MAYVLGFIYADGSIYVSERGKYLSVVSTDKPIISNIKKCLASAHPIKTEKSRYPNRKIRYRIRVGNKDIYDSLKEIGLYPSKSLTIKLPKVPKEFFSDFVLGYFDGDGCVYIDRAKGITQKVILKKLSVIFTSGSKIFLEELLLELKKFLDLKQEKIYESHRSYQLRLSTHDSVEMFKFIYKNASRNSILERKLDIFSEYFKVRPQRVDNTVRSVLLSLS